MDRYGKRKLVGSPTKSSRQINKKTHKRIKLNVQLSIKPVGCELETEKREAHIMTMYHVAGGAIHADGDHHH